MISIASFYDNFKKYVYDIADNAIKRIIRDDLNGALTEDKYKLVNHFKPKEYEPFYNSSTNTLTILLECSVEESFNVNGFEFQSIISNSFAEFDPIILQTFATLTKDAANFTSDFIDSPANLNEQ